MAEPAAATVEENPQQEPAEAPSDGDAQASKWDLWAVRVGSWVLVVVVWQYLSTYVLEPFIMPPPLAVLRKMVEITVNGQLFVEFWYSFSKLLQAFVAFFVIGAVLGTWMALKPWAEDFLRDALSLAISLPGLVYILLLLLILGVGGLAPIAATVLAVAPYVALQFWEGVKGVPTGLLEMGASFRLSRFATFRQIVVPSLTPFILTAITHGFSIGWRLVILTEVFGGSRGIGNMMRREFGIFSVRGVVAWAMFFFIFTVVLDRLLFAPISRHVLRWREA